MEPRSPISHIEQRAHEQRIRGADMQDVARRSRTSAQAMVQAAADMRRMAREAVERARQHLSGLADGAVARKHARADGQRASVESWKPMTTDRGYIAENDRERQRLEALVARLDDAALSRAMPAGWTVAGVLAHLAFWDQRIIVFIEMLQRGVKVPVESEEDVDWINDAAKPAQLALPPRRAATLAVETARATDRAVATLSDDLLTRNAAASKPIFLLRAQHRREHLDEIEKVLAGG